MGMIMDKKSAIFYLYRKSFKNRVKKALRKPVTYIYGILAIAYFVMIFGSFRMLFSDLGSNPASAFSAILSAFVFIFVPSNLIAYSKRKGLIFKASDIHFLFSAPVSPKRILFYAHLKNIIMGMVLSIVLSIGGVLWFHMPVWKMVVYFIFTCVAENILEASLMIICYGNERLSRKQMNVFTVFLYALIGVFVAIGVAVYLREGASLGAVLNYLHSPVIQMVPVLGWSIAFIHLLFMDITIVNAIGSILFFAVTILLFIVANRMKCTGEYYEDAIKFSEDYEIARQKGKKGEVAVVGWKQKYGKAAISYKGGYAKAIFYRQLLEYKKNRFFIFGFYTLVCVIVGIALAVVGHRSDFGEFAPFIMLGVMAYIVFIFSSYAGKWSKEMSKPYTYLIPDSSFNKLWYATLIEHIRAIIDGCLLTLPAGIVLRLPVLQIILIIAVYVCLQACKLYSEVMVEAFLGNILGSIGKQFARLFFEGLVIALGIIGAAAATLLVSVEAGFLALIIISVVLTSCMMLVASMNFSKMETVD